MTPAEDTGSGRYLGESAEAQGVLPAGGAGVVVEDGGVGRHGVVHQRAVHPPHRHLRAHVAQDVRSAAQLAARHDGIGSVSQWGGNRMHIECLLELFTGCITEVSL